jgi:hypothetical protein
MKRRTTIAAAILSSVLLASGMASAQTQPKAADPCPKGAAPRVEGQVVKIDAAQNRVTVRGGDGTTHEFQASKETLQDMKVGDTIKANLRVPEHCKK